jgi:hypothetical protein
MSARWASQAPTAASRASASQPLTTRQMVALDGTGGSCPRRAYNASSSTDGVSATHPAIAVNERIPATTAAAARVSTAATGCTRPVSERPSLT